MGANPWQAAPHNGPIDSPLDQRGLDEMRREDAAPLSLPLAERGREEALEDGGGSG